VAQSDCTPTAHGGTTYEPATWVCQRYPARWRQSAHNHHDGAEMKLTIECGALADAMSWAAQSLAARPAAPVLAGLKLAAGGSELTVSGYDYEIATSGSAPAQVDEPGAVLVSGRLLAEIVRTLPHRPVDLAVESAKLKLACGPYRYTLQSMPLNDYPATPTPPEISGHVSAAALATAIAQVAAAAGHDDTLPFLTGIRIEADGEQLRLVATDRYRLTVRDLPWQPLDAGAHTSILVPAKQLGSLTKALAHGDKVALALPQDGAHGEGQIGLHTPGRTATARLLDGEFIKYERIFPAAYTGHAVIETTALIEAVKGIALVAERNTPIRLIFSISRATIEAGSNDEASASVSLDAAVTGPDLTLAANPAYLLDGLTALGTPYVRFEYTAPTKPTVLTGQPAADGAADQAYRYLFIPVRTAS
jgi:DNA polymerase-3 subunit beta